jgi:hypothetical protein
MCRAAISISYEGSVPRPSIVDTGAPYTFVPAHWLPRAVGGKTLRLGVGGEVYRGRQAKLRVQLPSGLERRVNAFVAEHPRADFALLGTDFLQSAGCRVDLRRHKLICPPVTEDLTELFGGITFGVGRKRRAPRRTVKAVPA